jgi:hypothetical protein
MKTLEAHRISIFVILLVLFVASCKHEPFVPKDDPLKINLVWNKSYSDETQAKVDTGLLWTFSYLGAEFQSGSFERGFVWDGGLLKADFSKLGFSPNAEESITKVISAMKQSEEYKVNGGVDLGRFVSFTLLSSANYYAITGVPATLTEFLSTTEFQEKPTAIMKSGVSVGPRIVYLPQSTVAPALKFMAQEGMFDSANATIEVQEHEVFDVMPNGQLRFAIYDGAGDLIQAADPVFSFGGKPSKCLWCHESNVNPNFNNSPSHPAFTSVGEFNQNIADYKEVLRPWRESLSSDLDFGKSQHHTYAELLYIGFMEPTVYRLASEWAMSETEVQNRLVNLTKYDHPEFEFFQGCYPRKDVDLLAPFEIIMVSDWAREPSNSIEPSIE